MVTAGHIRWLRRSLIAAQVALTLAAVWLLVDTATWAMPRMDVPGSQAAEAPVKLTEGGALGLRPLGWFEPLWTRDLRQPPIPPITEPQPEVTAPPPELPTLLGVFVESQRSFAHLRDQGGQSRVYPLGATIDGYRITAVQLDRICLQRDEIKHWVDLPASEGASKTRKGKGRR